MANNGKDYEFFVAKMQQALLNADVYASQKNIQVEVNKKIVDNCGIERQFDIYWEYELGGLTYKTVIECKDYASSVTVEKIDSLIGKVKDIPDLKAVFATKMGYQSGAKIKAEQNKIELLVVREQNNEDWTDADGTPLIKVIDVKIHAFMPANIEKFIPVFDVEWIKENTNIDINKPLNISALNTEIIIEDIQKSETYSYRDMASKLSSIGESAIGRFEKEEIFENAFIYYKELKLKLNSYKVEYTLSEPVQSSFEIDFSKELIGVVEYLQRGTKKTIFKNGVIK
jgi:hypothetical protein